MLAFVVDGIWKEWSPWDSCTHTCGNGTQTRIRECEGPFHGGQNCEGFTEETQACFLRHCPGNNITFQFGLIGDSL